MIACDELVIGVDELQVALGEVESERDNLLEMKEKMQNTKRGLSESEERENLLLKDIEDLKAKHAFAQAEFEQERDELNDVVTKSKLLLQVNTTNVAGIANFRPTSMRHFYASRSCGQPHFIVVVLQAKLLTLLSLRGKL